MGGKSRKSGGVSKKLIQTLKSAQNSKNNEKGNENNSTRKSLFGTTRKPED